MLQAVETETIDAFKASFQHRKNCPICSSTEKKSNYHKVIRDIPLTFNQCKNCTLVYQDPYPSNEGLLDYFSSSLFIKDDLSTDDLKETLGYYDYENWDECYRKTALIRLNRIAKYQSPPGELLEIGTATGSFLNEARKFGFNVRGLDVSKTFAESAMARYKVQIDQGFIEEAQLPYQNYDVVSAFGGIACWYDPLRALARIKQALKPGGVFVFNYSHIDNPLARFSGEGYPEYNHASLLIYTRPSMHRLLTQAGFDVLEESVEWQYASMERIVTYWKSNFLRKIVDSLGINGITLKVPAIGTRFVICRARDTREA